MFRDRARPQRRSPRGLVCRNCGSRRLRVVYTRRRTDGVVQRRRECRDCGSRMTTWERVVPSAFPTAPDTTTLSRSARPRSPRRLPPFARGDQGGPGQLVPATAQPRADRRMISDPGFRISDLKRRFHLARRQIRNPNFEIQNSKSHCDVFAAARSGRIAPRPGALPGSPRVRHENLPEKGIEYARRLLGHANISTTQRYMHLDDRELADAQDLVE